MGRDRHAAGESGNRNDGPAERWTPNTTLVREGEAVGFDCHPVARVGERGNMCVGTAPRISTPPLPGLQGRSKTKPRHSVVCSVISGLAAHVIDTIQATYTCAAQNAPAALLEKRCHFGGCCEACDVR